MILFTSNSYSRVLINTNPFISHTFAQASTTLLSAIKSRASKVSFSAYFPFVFFLDIYVGTQLCATRTLAKPAHLPGELPNAGENKGDRALYRCAHVSFRGHTVPVPCLRRRTEGPPGSGGARGPGSVRAGAFAAEHLAQWALLAAPSPPPASSPLPSPRLTPVSRALSPPISPRGLFPFLFLSPSSLSRSRVIYRAANSIFFFPALYISYFVPLCSF